MVCNVLEYTTTLFVKIYDRGRHMGVGETLLLTTETSEKF